MASLALNDNDADNREPGHDERPEVQNRQLIYELPDEALVKKLRSWFHEDLRAQEDERKNRHIDWRMWAGDQWEEDARERARAQRRPCLTLNYVLPTICAVEGEERSNRQQIKVYGAEETDDRGAYAFDLLIRHVMNESNGEYAISGAFRHSTICGQGWLQPDVDYFSDPDGQIVVRHVDEDEIVCDSNSVAPDASDARRLTRMRWLKDDELEAMFPGKLDELHGYCQAHGHDLFGGPGTKESDGSGYRDIYTEPGKLTSKVYDSRKREWLVLEHWWFEIEPGYVARHPVTGQTEELTLEEGDALKSQAQADLRTHMTEMMAGRIPFGTPGPAMPQMDQRPVRRYYQAFSCFNLLLEKNPSPVPEARRIPYVPIFGYFDKLKRERFGIVRNIADIQRQHNVEQSALVHLVQLMPKAGWKAPRGAYHDKQKWANSAAEPGAMLEYNAQKGEPKPIEQPQVPRHLVDLAMSRMQNMRDISGVNVEMTGQRVAGDAGVVMEMRKKAAMTILANLFDNLRLAKKVLGKLLIVYIQAFMPMGRRIRVLGPRGQAEYVQFTEDMQFARFDAMIDETEATVNDRLQTLTLLQTVLPTLIDAGIPIPPTFIDLFPIPPHIKDEWKATLAGPLPGAAGAPPPGPPAPAAPPQ